MADAGSSKAMRAGGWLLSGLFVLFMTFDTVIKLIRLPVVGDTLAGLGWPRDSGFGIGVMELVFLALYVFPRTAVSGAVLMTGVLGAAVATNVRVGNPLFSHELFGVYLGLLMWGGLWLREAGLRALMPWSARSGF